MLRVLILFMVCILLLNFTVNNIVNFRPLVKGEAVFNLKSTVQAPFVQILHRLFLLDFYRTEIFLMIFCCNEIITA